MSSKIFFLLTESIKGLYRAKLPALISSLTIAITLIVFTITYYGYINFIEYSFEIKKRYLIDVFFESSVSEIEAKEIFDSILLINGIQQGKFINKNEARKIFNNYFNADINKVIGSNPLPISARFDIASVYRDPPAMELLARKIRLINGVEQVSYRSGLITRIENIIDNIFNIIILIGIAIFIISAILVSNTIRLIIHSKESTIKTLNLLGATTSFIKLPFILEGIFQGLIGSIISILSLILLNSLVDYLFSPILQSIEINTMFIIIGNLFIGALLGFIGSYKGVSKYL